ncbi:MAG: DUF6580 family putative transport protein [Pirellulales bacterium]
MKRDYRIEWLLFAVLVMFGVLGRWFQLQWNVTPTAALALFAGFVFAQRRTALLVPVVILALSNLVLDTYPHAGEMLAVYSSFLIPAALGGLVRRRFTALRVVSCTLASSLLFFLITNFAVWLYRRGEVYADSFAGLLACYEAGLLFFRWMLAGDLVFAAVIFGSYAVATSPLLRRAVRVSLPRRDNL